MTKVNTNNKKMNSLKWHNLIEVLIEVGWLFFAEYLSTQIMKILWPSRYVGSHRPILKVDLWLIPSVPNLCKSSQGLTLLTVSLDLVSDWMTM